MADAGATKLPALDNTMGVLFVGTIFAMALWGASTVQTYYYFNRYTKDEWWMKTMVALVWMLDSTHQGLITHTVYTYLITEYGNPAALGVIVDTLLIEVLFSALVVLIVQAFFVLRVWKLSHGNIPLAVVLSLLVSSSFIISVVYTVKALRLKTFANLVQIFDLSRSINILGAASDVAITASLIWLLQRSRTGFKRSDSIINRLIMFSLNTGLLTGLDAIMSLITNTVFPTTFIYICFYVNVSRLYCNSLLATLNSRRGLNGVDESTGEQSVSLSQGRYRSRAVEIEAPSTIKGVVNPRTLSIKVNTETETVRDQEEGNIKNYRSFAPL
ncbi:uncharacterized protein FOMMEDRAFT_23354 [Fomitiporia mediterranea MF3/22]|uniref:uncharacterized protein n=1 Tax=Fomitiporia mediterranea (strain MF3/22) TaxID=694068 RepID=UPI00044075C5|nr:uncharacterized protein FOMMEDRAFT_23354 [Fomitiporia mediterranea MF3/22]EJC98995.1 hypothetical protein FOMMEDRAFT_23354 [Fomitiporia mediterranea MF3/22]